MATELDYARECAARGAAFLDEKLPDWAFRINLDKLRLSDCTMCIIGQLLGDYERASNLGIALWSLQSDELGFTTIGEYYPLQWAWKELLEERRKNRENAPKEEELVGV